MAHFKRRRRRRGGIKGHCFLCSLRSRNGLRNGRRPTPQERSHFLKYREGIDECRRVKLVFRGTDPPLRGYT